MSTQARDGRRLRPGRTAALDWLIDMDGDMPLDPSDPDPISVAGSLVCDLFYDGDEDEFRKRIAARAEQRDREPSVPTRPGESLIENVERARREAR